MKKVEKTQGKGDFEAEITKISEESKAKIAELTNDLQRTRADFENYRKQVEVQRENAAKTAKFATVMRLLPLMKELELAKIVSDEGTEFNPDIHDAVMVEGDGEKEVVAETLRTGYYYQGEVLRPAMVKVKRV